MLLAERKLRVEINVGPCGPEINDLVQAVAAGQAALCDQLIAGRVWDIQEQALGRVLSGEAELVCSRCGVVCSGPGSALRRGVRKRSLRTSLGRLEFQLRQVTCPDCRRTWSPFLELLGLIPRQRVLDELLKRLVDWVTEFSYEKTTRLAGEWLGATVSPRTLHTQVQRKGEAVVFTEEAPVSTVVADGTKVPAGERLRGEDVSVAFQLQGHGACATVEGSSGSG